MERVLEPELMDDEAQSLAYAQSDFNEPHNAFIEHFRRTFPDFSGRLETRIRWVADLGCGTADPTIRFARAYPNSIIIGIDGSEAMLALGRKAVIEADLLPRIILEKRILPDHGQSRHFNAVISNSLLHHLPNPNVLWSSAIDLSMAGAPIFVMDLTRPPTKAAAEQLVDLHAQGAPELMTRDFYNSLLASFEPEEVRVQLDRVGLDRFRVEVVSDRHMMIYGRA